jgi:hypothetical protein
VLVSTRALLCGYLSELCCVGFYQGSAVWVLPGFCCAGYQGSTVWNLPVRVLLYGLYQGSAVLGYYQGSASFIECHQDSVVGVIPGFCLMGCYGGFAVRAFTRGSTSM